MSICTTCTVWFENLLKHHIGTDKVDGAASKLHVEGGLPESHTDDQVASSSRELRLRTRRGFDFEIDVGSIYENRETCWFCSHYWMYFRLAASSSASPISDEELRDDLTDRADESGKLNFGTEAPAGSGPPSFTICTNYSMSSVEFELRDAGITAQSRVQPQYVFTDKGALVRSESIPDTKCSTQLDRSGNLLSASVREEGGAAHLAPDRLLKLRSWLDTCDSSHSSCSSARLGWMPSLSLPLRLLHLSPSGDTVKLVRSETLSDRSHLRYASLSHCWGREPFQTLTKENYESWLQSIDVSTMNRTFRETIALCRGLAIEYLWIDSLCIVQNSDGNVDWQRQAPDMHHIYMNAYVNFCATSSKMGRQGLVRPLSKQLFDNLVVALPGNRMLVPSDSVVEVQPSFLAMIFAASPIFSRGWCVQELFLAPRTIHMSDLQVHWRCRNSIETEYGEELNLDPFTGSYISEQIGTNKDIWSITGNGTSARSIEDTWFKLAENYSKTQLSFLSDKEIAFKGVTAIFAARFKELQVETTCIAGCWTSALIRSLLWCCRSRRPNTDSDELIALPSWSWLSSKRPVEFDQNRQGYEYMHVMPDETADDAPPPTRHLAQLDLASDDQLLGNLPSQHLLMQAPFFDIEQDEYEGAARLIHFPETDHPLDTSLWRIKSATGSDSDDLVLPNLHMGPLSSESAFQVELDDWALANPRSRYICALAWREDIGLRPAQEEGEGVSRRSSTADEDDYDGDEYQDVKEGEEETEGWEDYDPRPLRFSYSGLVLEEVGQAEEGSESQRPGSGPQQNAVPIQPSSAPTPVKKFKRCGIFRITAPATDTDWARFVESQIHDRMKDADAASRRVFVLQ